MKLHHIGRDNVCVGFNQYYEWAACNKQKKSNQNYFSGFSEIYILRLICGKFTEQIRLYDK
jgi:hypothetical protein